MTKNMNQQQQQTQPQEVGFVKNVRDFLVYLDGLPTTQINDIVENGQGIRGWISALLPDKVEVLMLDEGLIQPGQLFKKSGTKLTIPVGQFLLGRAINPLGVPLDGKGIISGVRTDNLAELDNTAPGISQREFITEQFDSGITLVDSIIPIGKGQRELVVGDARSGKTDFLIDIIVNQKHTNMICIYASIGKPIAEVRSIIDIMQANQALPYTIIVATSSSDPGPLIYLTPQAALTIAEYFQKQGKDVLVILDDMGNHAKIYREISLLGNRSPGRESYPGDIFYQQAHLLERAGNFKQELGGGSITALPVIELSLSDFTTLIPTNLMSMTDGHLLFKSAFYNQGQRPPIDISLSVSRVGQQTQNRIQNALATQVKQVLAQAAQLETVSRFSFELPMSTQLILHQKEMIEEIIKQMPLTYTPKEIQIILLALPFTHFMQDKNKDFIHKYKQVLTNGFTSDPQLSKVTKSLQNYTNEQELLQALEACAPRIQQLLSGVPSETPQPPQSPPAKQSPQLPTNNREKEGK